MSAAESKSPTNDGGDSRLDEFFAYLQREYRYYKAVLGDSRTPSVAKWLIGSGVGYMMLPLDLIPDVIPIIGKLDDLLLVPALIGLGLALVPDFVKNENRGRIRRLRLMNADGTLGPPLLDTQALPGPFGIAINFSRNNVGRLENMTFPLLDLALQYGLLSVPGRAHDISLPDRRTGTSQEQLPAITSKAQTQLDLNFRAFPRIVGLLSNRVATRDIQFINSEAAYKALPKELADQLQRVRLRWLPHPDVPVDAVLQGNSRGEMASEGAHVISGAQFVNLMLSESCEILDSKVQTADKLLDDVQNHVLEDTYCSTHDFTENELIAWDPRRVLLKAPTEVEIEPQFIYPVDVNDAQLC